MQVFEKDAASGKITLSESIGVSLEGKASLADILNGDVGIRVDPGGQSRPGRISGDVKAKAQIPSIQAIERATFKPDWLRSFVQAIAKKALPVPLGDTKAKWETRTLTFDAGVSKLRVTIKLTFNSAFPDIDVGLGSSKTVSSFAQEEVLAQSNQQALKIFAAKLTAQGIAHSVMSDGLILQASQPRSIELPDGLEQALFSLQGQGTVPDFTLIAPNGQRITPSSANDQIEWVVNPDTFTAFYVINRPLRGKWTIETSTATAVFNVVTSDPKPQISVRTSQSAATANVTPIASSPEAATVLVQWDVSSANPNSTIGLYYDNDNLGANGVKIIEGLQVSSANNSYAWNLANVPSGEYYVYAIISDGLNAPVTSYSTSKVVVDDPSAPERPRNITAQVAENSVFVSWLPNQETNLAGYVVHYTSDLNSGNYDKSALAGLGTSLRINGLEPRKQYRLAVTAYNTEGRVSRLSDSQIVSTGESRVPFVQVTTPNGGETLTSGQSFTVQWIASDDTGIESQQILLSQDGGATYPVIVADNIPGTIRSYSWSLPSNLAQSALKIRVVVRDLANNISIDDSDNVFSSRPLSPRLTSLSPNRTRISSRDLSVLIQGDNFAPGATVSVSGQKLTTVFTNDTQLTVILPALLLKVAGTLNLLVENPDGQKSEAQPIAVVPAMVTTASAASFSSAAVAPDSIVAAFGTDLAPATQKARTLPLPTSLAGVTVKVKDRNGNERLAPLFFVSPNQVNYLMPDQTVMGQAMITADDGAGNVATGTVEIVAVVPGLFTANANGQGVAAAQALRVRANGSQTYEPVFRFDSATNKFVSVPIDLGPVSPSGSATEKVFLILYGTGIRRASDPNGDKNLKESVRVLMAGTEIVPTFAGMHGSLVGVDQINVEIPRRLAGRGEIDVLLRVDGKTSNTVKVNIK